MTAAPQGDSRSDAVPVTCSACHERLTTYYTAGEFIAVCPACRDQIIATAKAPPAAARFLRAVLIGVFAAILAGTIWYAFTRFIGWGLGAVALSVGVIVGAWTFRTHRLVRFSGPFTVTNPPA
jgi:predicted secreted protein